MDGSTYQDKRRIFEQHFLLKLLSPCEIDTLISYSRYRNILPGARSLPRGRQGEA